MAGLDRIEFFGIAADRDVVIHHDTSRCSPALSSSVVSFASIAIDEDRLVLAVTHVDETITLVLMLCRSLTCRPWFSPTNKPPMHHPCSPVSSSHSSAPGGFVAEEDDRLMPSDGPPISLVPPRGDGLHELFEDAGDGSSRSGGYGLDLTPLDRFAGKSERHERIALALAADARYEMPYLDYLPCPGSAPGSPAMSTATDGVPPAAPPVPLLPFDQSPSPAAAAAAIGVDLDLDLVLVDEPEPVAAVVAASIPMSRYLADVNQPHEWLAVVLERPPPHLDPADDDNPYRGDREHEATPVSTISLSLSLGDDPDNRDHGASARFGAAEPPSVLHEVEPLITPVALPPSRKRCIDDAMNHHSYRSSSEKWSHDPVEDDGDENGEEGDEDETKRGE